MSKLNYKWNTNIIIAAGCDDERDLLMDITSFGILIYSVFTIVAGCLNDNSYEPPELVVVNGLAELVQVLLIKRFEIENYKMLKNLICLSSNSLQLKRFFFIKVNIQLLFIADLRQRRVHEDSPQHKPGRQIVTFLLISNLGLWITYNFEIQKVIFSNFAYLSITIMITLCIGYILWGWAILHILGKRYARSKWILWLFSMGGDTTDDFASLCFLSVPFNGCSSWALEKLLPNKKTFKRRGLNTRKLYLFISRKYFIGYSTVLHNFLSENRSFADLSLHRT